MEKKKTIADKIIRDLAEQIINNKYRPNDKLPNERDLAELYKVSRGRVREALSGLSTAGLIDIRSNQGSFVKEYSERVNTDTISWLLHPPHTTFLELYEVREVLEKAMYSKAFDSCNSLDLKKIEKSLENLLATDNSNYKAFADAVDDCDRTMAKITRNPLFINLIETMIVLRRETVERLLSLEGSSERSKLLRAHIVKAFQYKDKAKVTEAVDKFFFESKKPFENEEI